MKNYELRITNYGLGLILLSIVVLLLNISFSKAQTIDSLINEAIANNPQIKSLDYKIKSSEYKAESVNSLPPPTVGIGVSQVPFNSINLWNDPMSQNLTISQMFPLGGKIEAMTNVQKSATGIESNNLKIYKNELASEVKMEYYSLWLVSKKIEIQQESINLLNQLLNSIMKIYEINRISQADILTLKSEIAFNETQLVILKNQMDAEVYKMNKLLGRELNDKGPAIDSTIEINAVNFSKEELDILLADNNPSLQKINSMIAMNKNMSIANSKEKVPDLMLEGMIMRMPQGMLLTSKTPPDMITGNGNAVMMYGLMASITLPFAPWSKSSYEYKEQEIQTSISSIESEKDDMLRGMKSQLNTAYVKMKTSADLIKLYSENVIPLYEKAREAQVSSYQNGQSNLSSVIDANRMLLMESMNFYMAQADYNMAIAEIEMMIGKSISK